MTTHDPLEGALGGLAAASPPDLLDRVMSRWTRAPGPLGDVHVAFTDHGVSYLRPATPGGEEEFLASYRDRFGRPVIAADQPPAGLLAALRGGDARALRVDLRGLTGFERDVLGAARTIPPGQVRPYAWVAAEIGRPRAVRAVGTALGHNPVPLLVPCHRVTRSDGAPGEYVFGAPMKRDLLRAEGVDLDGVHDLARRGVHYVASDTTGVVCYPTCGNARRITPEHRRGFRSLAEAERAGYRPCGACRPPARRPG